MTGTRNDESAQHAAAPGTALRSRCSQRLAQLPLPEPFTVERFREALEARRGRMLTISVMPGLAPGESSGVWIATETADHVFVDAAARPLHREHIALHELAHIICDHQGAAGLSEDDAAALLPSLTRDTIARVLGRTRYTQQEEQEAELLATMIAQRVHRRDRQPHDPEVQALRGRLRSTLG